MKEKSYMQVGPTTRVLPMAIDVDINTSDTSTPTHNQISGLGLVRAN
jgi:hypothetical protein